MTALEFCFILGTTDVDSIVKHPCYNPTLLIWRKFVITAKLSSGKNESLRCKVDGFFSEDSSLYKENYLQLSDSFLGFNIFMILFFQSTCIKFY